MVRSVTSNQKGIALFMVLWVLVLLAVIVGEFCHSMGVESGMVLNLKERVQAHYLAEAGFNMGVCRLVDPPPTAMAEENDNVKNNFRVNADNPEIPLGHGGFKLKIGNESGKVDINAAGRKMLELLLNGFDLEKSDRDVILDSILDWRDKDQLHRVNGAEDKYYQSLPEPYDCKDGPFNSVEELMLVKGVTEDLFWGGLKERITVFSDQNTAALGSIAKRKRSYKSRININAASRSILLALPLMTGDLADDLLLFREEKDFKSLAEFKAVVGGEVYSAVKSYITLKTSAYYSIESMGFIEGSRVKAVVTGVIRIDPGDPKGYRMLRWKDGGDSFDF